MGMREISNNHSLRSPNLQQAVIPAKSKTFLKTKTKTKKTKTMPISPITKIKTRIKTKATKTKIKTKATKTKIKTIKTKMTKTINPIKIKKPTQVTKFIFLNFILVSLNTLSHTSN